MVRSGEISEDIKEKIISYHKSGKGYKSISKMMGLHKSTIRSIICKWKTLGTVMNLPRSGRPPKISTKAKRKIIKEVTKKPEITPKELQACLALAKVKVSEVTIRRTLGQGEREDDEVEDRIPPYYGEEPPSPLHLPVLRRTKSQSQPQSRPQQVKFSDDVMDKGYYGGLCSRQPPMSERTRRRTYHMEEEPQRRPANRHHKRRQGRKTRSENALHLPSKNQGKLHVVPQIISSSIPEPRNGILLNHSAHSQHPYHQTPTDFSQQGIIRMDHFQNICDDDDDDDWCSTCSSSSSESEEEGFFLGQPIPKPRSQSFRYYTEDYPTRVTALTPPFGSRTKLKKKGHKGKNCIIS